MFNKSEIELAENWVKEKYLSSDIHLPYHNWVHVQDVYNSALQIFSMEMISDYDQWLILIAILFHDIGLLYTEDDHEKYSCKILHNYYKESKRISEENLETISQLILATQLPQKPKNYLEKVICDADLDNLHRDDFLDITNQVYKEKLFREIKITWQEMLIETKEFLEKHTYCTDSYKNRYKKEKTENIKKIEDLILAQKK